MFLALLLAAVSGGPESHYVDASLDLDGRLFSWRFLDLEQDGTRELVLAIRAENGERELRVHRLEGASLGREAERTVPILPDVLAWGAADVRDEPGLELLFLTRSGAWSYSPTLPGYRDNVRRLARAELIYDMPDPRALPFWAYVLPAEGGDAVLLPERERLSIWGPTAAAEPDADRAYALRAALSTSVVAASSDELGAEGRSRGGGPRVAIEESSPFLPEALDGGSSLLEDAYAADAPALRDVNGDGYLDLVIAGEEHLVFYLGSPQGPPSEPTRVEALPEALLTDGESDLDLQLHDIDEDGWLDLIALVAEEASGLDNRVHRILVYRGREERLFGEKPDQVLRIEAGDAELRVTDVDGDGHLDLAVEKLELPSIVGAVSGVEFTFSLLVFPGEGGRFAKRSTLLRKESFDEQTAIELAAGREWKLDCNGDGSADLVEIDLQGGDIAIYRVREEKSRLRGSSWVMDRSPWKRFKVQASVDSLTVEDVNGDGLGDVISATDERLTVLLSVLPGGKR